jgi:hypothetical protein
MYLLGGVWQYKPHYTYEIPRRDARKWWRNKTNNEIMIKHGTNKWYYAWEHRENGVIFLISENGLSAHTKPIYRL